MRQFDLAKVMIKDINEETVFSTGALFFYDDGRFKSWEIELQNVDNGGSYGASLRDSKNVNIEVVTDIDKVYSGEVIVTRITTGSIGVDISLKGTGQLFGYNG